MSRRPAAAVCSLLMMLAGLLTVVAAPAEAALPSQARWRADVRHSMSGSRIYVERRVATGGNHLAVNFDIDNTSLATHYRRGHAVAVVLRLARFAKARRVSVLFNTGRLRGDGRMLAIARVLRRVGYPVDAICGRARAHERLAHSKQRCRRRFVGQGHTVIANVGNRSTDFTGGNYERAFRLPNYGNQLD